MPTFDPILGTEFIIEIDTDTLTATPNATRGVSDNFRTVVCLVSNGVDATAADQETTNKCSDGFKTSQSGVKSWSISGNGQAISDTQATADDYANFNELMSLWKSGKPFFARITNAANTLYYREGLVYVSSDNETQPNQEAITFDITLTGIGELFLAPPTA